MSATVWRWWAHGSGGPITQRHGMVRNDGRAWFDDDGYFHPFGYSLFYAPHGWAGLGRSDGRAQVMNNVQYMRGKADFCRVIYSLYPCGRQALRDFIQWAYDVGGQRTQVTVWGGGWDGYKPDPFSCVDDVRWAVEGIEHKVQLLEAANEFWRNGPSLNTVKEMTRRLMESGILTMSTACERPNLNTPPSVTIMRETRWWAQQVGCWHGDRAPGDLDWRFVRQAYDAAQGHWEFPYQQNEPLGPGSSVSSTYDHLRLATHRFLTALYGGSYVYHNTAGVEGYAHTRPTDGIFRPANLWETRNTAKIEECMARVAGWLPERCEQWNGSVPHVFNATKTWPRPDKTGLNKAHTARHGRQFLYNASGVLGPGPVKVNNDNLVTATFYRPDQDALAFEGQYRRGDVLTLPGDPKANMSYIAIGEVS